MCSGGLIQKSDHCAVLHSIFQVYDRDFLKPDDLLGQLELAVKIMLNWAQVICDVWLDAADSNIKHPEIASQGCVTLHTFGGQGVSRHSRT